MEKVIKNKKSLELVTSHSSGHKTNSEKFLYLFKYFLIKFEDIMLSSFWVIPKITSANLYKSIHDIINYSTYACTFESGKCGEEGKKLQKFEYFENKRSFLDEIKTFFIVFKGLLFSERIKN